MDIDLLAITREGVEFLTCGYENDAFRFNRRHSIENVEIAVWHPSGEMLAIVQKTSPNVVQLVQFGTWKTLLTFESTTPVTKIGFSPLGKFLQVGYRHCKDTNHQNLCVYNIENMSNTPLCKLTLKSFTPPLWPPFKFSSRDSYACLMLKNHVHIFTNGIFNINEPYAKIQSDEVIQSISVSNETSNMKKDPVYVAVFLAGRKGAPSSLLTYNLNSPDKICCKKSFYQAQEIQIKWNANGNCLLLKTHTDASDKSYYGADALYFLRSDGSHSTLLVSAEDGPLHDYQWNMQNDEFLVCKGMMPSELLTFDSKNNNLKGVAHYNRGLRNTLVLCPFSRLLIGGGFGNLAGEINVWSLPQKKLVAKTQSPCSVICAISPNGCFFYTATTSPRLRVDNRISIYSVGGECLHRQDYPCLYDVIARPISPDALKLAGAKQLEIIAKLPKLPTNQSEASQTATGTQKAVYCPPGSSGSLAAKLRAERQAAVNSRTAYKPPIASTSNRLPPGAELASPTDAPKAKNKKKKGKPKAKGSDDGKGEDIGKPGVNSDSIDHRSGESANVTTSESSRPHGDDSCYKKIRALKKKLQEVEALKALTNLDAKQLEKLDKEKQFRKDLALLEKQLADLGK